MGQRGRRAAGGARRGRVRGQEAAGWAAGLQAWGQDGARIERLRKSAEFTIFTPGSRAGRPVSILSSFAAPSAAERDDTELLAERASGTATSALVLAGVDAPPRSREHSLVAALLTHAWQNGASLDLASLIREVQSPPFDKVGVVDLESFFPAKERFALAMQLNGVLAAPGFEVWLEGDPLDPQTLFYDAAGRPRVSVFSIAHLGDAERMFFVSLLMNQMVAGCAARAARPACAPSSTWTRSSATFRRSPTRRRRRRCSRCSSRGGRSASGSCSPRRTPWISTTRAWRIRAPGFSDGSRRSGTRPACSTGSKAPPAASIAREADRLLSALKKRVFLMHNVHDSEPTVFETRWTLSYLRGPLSRDQSRR